MKINPPVRTTGKIQEFVYKKPYEKAQEKFEIAGLGKVRAVITHNSSDLAYGPYGEQLIDGGSFNYLFKPEVILKITRKISLGAHVRFTDSSLDEMLGAPDYFTNPYVSPFIMVKHSIMRFDAGYFTEHFTPLSFQRWDSDDSPPGAGGVEGGCRACAGLPGGISFQNLEELDPDYGLEGFRLSLSPGTPKTSLNMKLLYARPTVESGDCRYYTRHLFASSLIGAMNIGEFSFTSALRGINLQDESGVCAKMPFIPEKEPVIWQNIASGELTAGVKFVKVSIEKLWCRTKAEQLDTNGTINISDDFASTFSLNLSPRFRKLFLYVEGTYLHIGEGFAPEYRALSYYQGSEGYRGRFGIQVVDIWNSMSIGTVLFSKKVRFMGTPGNSMKFESSGIGIELESKVRETNIFLNLNAAFEHILDEPSDSIFACLPSYFPEPFDKNLYSISLSVEPVKNLIFTANYVYNEQNTGSGNEWNIARIFYLMTSVNY